MLKINEKFSDSALVCILGTNYRNHKPVFQAFGAQLDQSRGKSGRRINTVTAKRQNPDLLLISRFVGTEISPHL